MLLGTFHTQKPVDTRWLVRSTLVHSLSDESIHQSTERFKSVPPGTSWLFGKYAAAAELGAWMPLMIEEKNEG